MQQHQAVEEAVDAWAGLVDGDQQRAAVGILHLLQARHHSGRTRAVQTRGWLVDKEAARMGCTLSQHAAH